MDIIGEIRRVGIKKGQDEWETLWYLREELAGLSQYGLADKGRASVREAIGAQIRQMKIDLLRMGAAKEVTKKEFRHIPEWRNMRAGYK